MEVESFNEIMSKFKDSKNMIGQFLLGKTLGEGTFGKVKIGTHIVTGEKVAIKILEKIRILDEADKIRVDREIKILKSLMHHNIIQIYSVIENPTTIFLIMEYSSGGELYDYIVLKKRLSDFEACKFFHQIINGVEYIHKVGVVHRDLKPENLLLDHKNNIKIVDFGLSNIYKNGLNFRTPCGSPCYAAPEMILGKVYNGTQVDIWSIGVILYAMLCGFLPFDDPDNDVLYKKIIDGKFALPNFLPDTAKDLLTNILNTDPEKRYTLKQIRSHPWYNRIPVMINEGLLVGVITIPVDENILERMKKLGYNKDEVRENILNNRHNNATTTYYLLIKNHYRNGMSSVSDLVSIEFLRHIRNPYNLKFGDSRGNGLIDSNVTYTNLLENKSNFDSNLCIDNEIELNEQDNFNNDISQAEEKPQNISRLNSVSIHNVDMRINVYESNFLTESNFKDVRNQYATAAKKTNSKNTNMPPIAHGRKDSTNKYSETSRARPSSARSPMISAYRSTSAHQSNQKSVKNTTQRKGNKFNLPIIPTGSKNIKKKLEEQYEKYVKNPANNRIPNKFKKGFLNTSAIFEKNTELRSQTIADKYKSENNKYGSNTGRRNISVSKRVGEHSPSTTDLKKSPNNNKRVSLNSRPPLSNKAVSSMKKSLNRSCPDIIDKDNTNTNTIFTIKEEKEDMNNTIKINPDKDAKKMVPLKSKERFANSATKSTSKNPTADKPRARPSSGMTRNEFYSNYGTGKLKLDEEKKPSNIKRLSIPRGDIKIPPITDSKPENKKIMATPSNNKETISKIATLGNSNNKNKVKEIPKAVTSRKKEDSSSKNDISNCSIESDATLTTSINTTISNANPTANPIKLSNNTPNLAVMANPNPNISANANPNNKNVTTKNKVENIVKGVITRVNHHTKTTKTPNVNIKTIKVIDSVTGQGGPGQPVQQEKVTQQVPANPRPSGKISNNPNASSSILNKPNSVRSSSMTPQTKAGKNNSHPIEEVVINSASYDLSNNNHSNINQDKFMDEILKVLLSVKIKYKPISGNKYKYSCNISKLVFETEIVKDANKLFAKFKLNEGTASEFKNICNKILSFIKI